jgi:hypothetical protein
MMTVRHQELDPDDLPAGTPVCGGQFVVEACLGRGGVAAVYRVQTRDGRRLALKLMVTRRAADGDQRERFDNEWKILEALRGAPYVVEVERCGRHDDGRPFFTMELLEAPTLADLIMDRALTVTRACRVIRDVADALDDLHLRGVIHRDVKPDNIMITSAGIRLLDFGFAYTRGNQHLPRLAGLTTSEHRPGTHIYMAPEQADGVTPDPSFDIYSLAVTLYEALVGHAPSSEMEPARMMMIKCSSSYDELSIAGRVLGLQEGLERLVDHGLRRNPALRLSSAAELRDQLDLLLEEMGDEDTRTAGVLEEKAMTTPFLRALPQATERAAAPEGRDRREAGGLASRVWFVAAVVLSMLGGGLWWELGGEPKQGPIPLAATGVPPEAEPEPEVERAPELLPAPKPAPTVIPEPQPEPRVEPQPKLGKARRKVRTPPRPPAVVEPPCTDVAAQAQAASRARQSSRVLQLTKSPRCWNDSGARHRLRVKALLDSGRLVECMELGSTDAQPEVQRLARRCAKQLEQEGEP